jgi:WD40 repeat protein
MAMRLVGHLFLGVGALICLLATLALADAKVELQSTGSEDAIGASVSKHGNHVAILAPKGSRWAVMIDGVEGPKIDALLNNITGGLVGGTYWIGSIPVAWSPQGDHSAYVGKVGDECVVFYDNKELTRGPIRNTGQINIGLSFSNNGKHFFYMDSDDAGKYRIVVDGKPGPGCALPPQLVLSPDGDHFAYVGYENSRGPAAWAVVDGHQVSFFGEQLQYTARNHLVSIITENNTQTLVIDGKPEIKATSLNPMWISPDGAQIALEITGKPNDPHVLMVNGKLIPGTEGVPVLNMYFSPDGKRWAALCQTKTGSKYMMIDGKKGDEYQDIPQGINAFLLTHWFFQTGNTDLANGLDRPALLALQPQIPGFMGDSSKFVYQASQGGRLFMITDDQESDGYPQILERFLTPVGNHLGFITQSNNGKQHVIVDGKDQEFPSVNVPGTLRVSLLTFSPDGSHYAYLYGNSYCLDGVAQPGMVSGVNYVFSPDGKHFGYPAHVKDQGCFVVDGKIVATDVLSATCAFFTPDSKHLIFLQGRSLRSLGTKDSKGIYVDGKMVTHYADTNAPPTFEVEPDGAMTFVARTDDTLKKFKITFDSDIDAVLAAAPQAKDK